MREKQFELASHKETERLAGEIRLLINVIEPDPEYQPWIVTDEASALDVSAHTSEEISRRLETYLGHPLPAPVSTPLWQLVEAIRKLRPGWPEDEHLGTT